MCGVSLGTGDGDCWKRPDGESQWAVEWGLAMALLWLSSG